MLQTCFPSIASNPTPNDYDFSSSCIRKAIEAYKKLIEHKKEYDTSEILKQLSLLAGEEWNSLNEDEDLTQCSINGQSHITSRAYFFVYENSHIFITPKGVKDLINHYHEKAAEQAGIDKKKLPKARIITGSDKKKPSTSSEGFLSDISSDEYRKKFANTTQVFFVESGCDIENHNNSTHTFPLFVKYDESGNMTVVSLDSVPKFFMSVKDELKLKMNDKLFYQDTQDKIQHSPSGCHAMTLKTYKQFLDELCKGHNMVDIISIFQGDNKIITILPEGFARFAQSLRTLKFLNEAIKYHTYFKSHTGHTILKTLKKYIRVGISGKLINTTTDKSLIKMAVELYRRNNSKLSL